MIGDPPAAERPTPRRTQPASGEIALHLIAHRLTEHHNGEIFLDAGQLIEDSRIGILVVAALLVRV